MTTQAPPVTDDPGGTSLPARSRLSPRKRARISRGVQYVVLVAVLVAVVLAIDWDNVGRTVFNVQAAQAMLPRLPQAFGNTVLYTLGAFGIGVTLGTLLALMRLSSVALYRILATVYVEFFRGIPALLFVITVAFAVPLALGIVIQNVVLKVGIALGMVSAAYIAETLRAGLEAVPKGQVEAARSLGMSHTRTTITVVIPQAFRIVLPPMTNEVILLTKDTALISAMGLMTSQFELTKLGQNAMNSPDGGGLTGLFVVGACYLVITIPLGMLARRLEANDRRRRA